MKCPICKSEAGKEIEISDSKTRDDHAKAQHPGMTGEDLETLGQPFPPHTMADAFPGQKK